MKYVVVIEKSDNGYSAYVPDLPGCIAAAYTRDETEQLIREAIPFHLESMREDNEPIPEPTATSVLVEA
jgi:predicted RNase H-like HicB family nuclease